jgi:hypothetical protein
MAAIHMDTHLASAAPLLARLFALDGLTPGASALRERLLRWDRHMDADSAEAAAYAAVRGAVVRRFAASPPSPGWPPRPRTRRSSCPGSPSSRGSASPSNTF